MGFNKEDISKMKTLLTEEFAKIPSDVKVTVRARKVTVKGPKGEVTKDFSHLACEIQLVTCNTKNLKGKHVRVRMWFGGYRQACATNTIKSLIINMLTGVTEGFEYRMRCVHAHFPINCIIPKDKSQIDIKNFLGGKQIKHVDMIKGVTCEMNPDVKDEIIFRGFDNAALSLCCARVNQSVNVGDKDERKFLDGIFVSKMTLSTERKSER